ncbi:MAG: hypothetical protein QOF68_3199 [Gaiellales bacterium]|jgi:hypothetical protein|nr:hypothetical protein [Gaiellales bacterium]
MDGMGREVRCLVRHGGEEAEAKALLETDEVIVRSPFRITVPRSAIASARADGPRLEIGYDGGPLVLELGEGEAAKWAHDIAHPKSLADKLGVKSGQRVRLIGDVSAELVGAGSRVDDGEADVVFVSIEQPGDLPRIGALQEEIARDGAIWAIRPKGRDDLTEAMVLAAGRDSGLYDVKTARISATHTGEKFVIPKERR